MRIDTINGSIFDALASLGQTIETGRYGMFSTGDQYAHPPFLRFRFKNIEKNDPIYGVINSVVDRFTGKLEWSLITDENTKNYLIIPTAFAKYLSDGDFYKKDRYISELGYDRYIAMMDDAASDIPYLSEAIRAIINNK